MTAPWPLTGRTAQLEELGRLYRAGETGGVVIYGPAGAGKTRLAEEALRLAEDAGLRVEREVGHPSTAAIPLGALAHLLPSSLVENLPVGQDERMALFHGARAELRRLAGDDRLVLLVDDLDPLDDTSVAVLVPLVVSRRVFLLGTIRTGGATGVMAPAAHAGPEGPDVPTTIDVEPGHKVFLVGHATGVQIYSCNATPSGPRWGFVGPRADLYGENAQLIATHFGGPTWQGTDGSTVVASRVDGVVMDSTAIPWLLLKTESTSTGPDGDRFSGTSFIQRTETTGGLQPGVEECNPETVGDIVEVPYTADYHFWKPTGG